MNKLSSD